MKQRVKIFTTTKSHWFEKNFDFIKESLEQSKGRTIEVFDVETFAPPTQIPIHKDKNGNRRPSWDWFKDTFTDKSEGYNVVVLHLSQYYKDKWGLSQNIGGSYKNDGEPFEFYLCADKTDKAKFYPFDEFTRRFIHEMLHGDSYTADVIGLDRHPREWVHFWDYDVRKIHNAPLYIDYTRYNIQRKVVNLLDKIINLYAKLISTQTR